MNRLIVSQSFRLLLFTPILMVLTSNFVLGQSSITVTNYVEDNQSQTLSSHGYFLVSLYDTFNPNVVQQSGTKYVVANPSVLFYRPDYPVFDISGMGLADQYFMFLDWDTNPLVSGRYSNKINWLASEGVSTPV